MKKVIVTKEFVVEVPNDVECDEFILELDLSAIKILSFNLFNADKREPIDGKVISHTTIDSQLVEE